MRLVVDASVAAKWALAEEHSAAALRLVNTPFNLLAPSLLWVEVAAALRKRLRRGDMVLQDFRDAMADMSVWNVASWQLVPLVRPAADIAVVLGHSVHDCVYLALAEQQQCPLVTADRRLHAKVDGSGFAGLTLWIGGLP